MKQRVLIAILVLAAVLGGGWWIDRQRAQRESLLSGFFENQPTSASSRLGGRVRHILVKEGDAVRAGQPLVQLEAESYAASTRAQQQAVEQAKQQYLETVRGPRPEEIAKQHGALREAQANLARLKNGPLPEEIRAARDRLRQAQAQYQKMRAGSRPEEIQAAQAAAGVALEKLRQAERGLTTEERAALKARLDAAVAAEIQARKDLDRMLYLYSQGAIARQQYDAAVSNYQQAQAHRQDAEETYRRAQEGTPPEELGQARETYRQAQAQLALVLHGNRKEDIEAARQEMLAADENLKLLLRGSRPEDIRAAQARVQQAQAALLELQRGNRPEDIARAKAALRQAELTAKSQIVNLVEQVVYSPFDGSVDRIPVAVGDLVAANTAVVQLSSPNDIWLRVYLPEDQLPKVKVNDAALLRVDGVSGDVQGRVESIDTKGQFTPANLQSPEERGKQVFGIRLRLAHADPRVKAGMYATVRRMGRWP